VIDQWSLSHGWSQGVSEERRETAFLALSVTELIIWRTVVVDRCFVCRRVNNVRKVREVGSFLLVMIVHWIAIRSSSGAMSLQSSQRTGTS